MIASVMSKRSNNGPKALISLVLRSTAHCPRTTPLTWSMAANRCTSRPSRQRAPREVLPSKANTDRPVWAGEQAASHADTASSDPVRRGPPVVGPAGSWTHMAGPADAHLRAQQRGQVHGPLGDRDERPGSAQDRAGTKGQNRDEPVPDTATLTRVGHRAQGFQQPLRRHGSHGSEASGVANGRGDQRRYTSGHGAAGDHQGFFTSVTIPGAVAVSALLLHHYRRVVVRRAVNYDFAGALSCRAVGYADVDTNSPAGQGFRAREVGIIRAPAGRLRCVPPEGD